MKYHTEELILKTKKRQEFLDITPDLHTLIQKYAIHDGFMILYNMHTTSGLWINEHEDGILEDMQKILDVFAPHDIYYRHDDLSVRTQNLEPGERRNGWAHIRSALFRTSETIPIQAGKLRLGKWQAVFYVELDGPRERTLYVQLYDLLV
ncbi:MAG: YjbQ family protein [Nitrospinota bacterium]|nr:MAG: YjbQ family protein [Nitrospinota bacterium]